MGKESFSATPDLKKFRTKTRNSSLGHKWFCNSKDKIMPPSWTWFFFWVGDRGCRGKKEVVIPAIQYVVPSFRETPRIQKFPQKTYLQTPEINLVKMRDPFSNSTCYEGLSHRNEPLTHGRRYKNCFHSSNGHFGG